MGRTSGLILCFLVPVLAMVGFVVLAARVVERSDAALGTAGLEFLLSGIDRTVELNLQLGLPLTELQQIDTILENAVAATPDVLAADVINQAGMTLFSTDRGAVGEPIPAAWSNAIAVSRGNWRALERQTVTFGEPITNDFGQAEGWVAIIVDAERLAPPLSRTPTLFPAAAPFIVGAAAMALLLGVIVSTRSGWRIRRVAAHVRARTPATHPRTRLEAVANIAIDRLDETERRLERVHKDLRRLDAEL